MNNFINFAGDYLVDAAFKFADIAVRDFLIPWAKSECLKLVKKNKEMS